MAFEIEREVNEHFAPFYPHVAEEVLAEYGAEEGRGLEIGPYGPGVAVALARLCPAMSFVCGDAGEEALAYQREAVARAGLEARVGVRRLEVRRLPFGEGAFDLAVFRGGLFLWEDQGAILAEMDRVLRPGGLGALGGGFGAGAPDALIEANLPRARELNDRLGKRRISLGEAEALVRSAGIAGRARIADRHGLWIFWRKA